MPRKGLLNGNRRMVIPIAVLENKFLEAQEEERLVRNKIKIKK